MNLIFIFPQYFLAFFQFYLRNQGAYIFFYILMMKRFQINDGKWNWLCISSNFQMVKENKARTISLTPTHSFYQERINGQSQSLKVEYSINIEKAFEYENNIGWVWHKNTRIPLVSLKIQLLSKNYGAIFKHLDGLHARLHIVKLKSNSSENYDLHLEDVGLNGISDAPFSKNCAYFSGNKFNQTSSHHEGAKFHLLIIIYQKTQQGFEKIISSLLSSPIFVDSRKHARYFDEQKVLSYTQLFDPSLLSRKVEKKIQNQKVQVNDSFEELNTYLSAKNIKNKTKHPMYFAIKFPNIFNIYFRHSLFKRKPVKIYDVLIEFQKTMIMEISQKQRKFDKKNSKKAFIITIRIPQTTKDKGKFLFYFEDLQSKSILVCAQEMNFDNDFTNIKKTGNLCNAYKDFYRQGKKIRIKTFNENEVQSSQQDQLFSSQSNKVGKNKKEDMQMESNDDVKEQCYEKKQALCRRQSQRELWNCIFPSETEENYPGKLKFNNYKRFDPKNRSSPFQFISTNRPNLVIQPRSSSDFSNQEIFLTKKSAFQRLSSSSSSLDNHRNERHLLKSQLIKNEIFSEIDRHNIQMKNLIFENEQLKNKIYLLFDSLKNNTEASKQLRLSKSSFKDQQSN